MKKIGNHFDKISMLLSLGVSKTEIAKQIGVSRQGLHKYLARNADKLGGDKQSPSHDHRGANHKTEKSLVDNNQPRNPLDDLLDEFEKENRV